MKRKKYIQYNIFTAIVFLTSFLHLQSLNIGAYDDPVMTTMPAKSAKFKTVELTPNILSYGGIIRLQNENTSTFIGLEERYIGGKEDPTLDTYWYIYPEKTEDKNIKNKHAIKNGATVRIVNVVNGKELGEHPWVLEAKGEIEAYAKKEHRFVLKDPDNGTYLTGSLDILGETTLYKLNSKKKLSNNGYWLIKDFYPYTLEREFKKDDIIAIKCLSSDRYLTFQGNEIRPQGNDLITNLVAPTTTKLDKNTKFTVDRAKGALAFKLFNKYYLRVSTRTNWSQLKGFNRFYYKTQGILQVWNETIKSNQEKFRLEGFYIKSKTNNGYLKNMGPIKNFVGGNWNTPIISPYSNPIKGFGDPNKREAKALFAFIKVKGQPIIPILPEEATEEEYGKAIEAADIEFKKPLKGKYKNWTKIKQPGIAEIIFSAKAIDNIIIGLASEAKDYKKNERIYEIVIGGGLGKEANTYSLIRNEHMGKASDSDIGTFKMGKHIPNKDWNSFWAKVVGKKISFGSGKTPGENIILKWEDPSEEGILVKYIGLSNYKNPVYFKDIEYLTPKVKEEVKAEFFTDKLKGARSIKIFKNQIDKYISLIPEATESEIKTKAFFDEVMLLSQNTPKGKQAELKRLIESVRWNPKLVTQKTENIVNYLAIKSGVPMSFNKKLDIIEGLIGQAYTDQTIKEFLTMNREDIVVQLKLLAEESADSSPENKEKVNNIIETVIYDPTFSKYVSILESVSTELTKPVTIETLIERIASGSAAADDKTETRFMKVAVKLISKEIQIIKEENKKGKLSKESKQKIVELEKLLKSIKFGIDFEEVNKKQASKLLSELPTIKAEEVKIEPPKKEASNEEKVAYLISATTNKTLKSEKDKRVFFETISQLIKNKNLNADLIEKIRRVLGIIKWHTDVNDQEDALIKYYESQIAIPVTIDDKINQLLKEVLTVSDESSKKSFLIKIDKVISLIEKDLAEKKKIDSLPNLKKLLKTMTQLPNFATEKESIAKKLTTIKKLIEKENATTTKKIETIKKTTKTKITPIRRRRIATRQSRFNRGRGRTVIPTRPKPKPIEQKTLEKTMPMARA